MAYQTHTASVQSGSGQTHNVTVQSGTDRMALVMYGVEFQDTVEPDPTTIPSITGVTIGGTSIAANSLGYYASKAQGGGSPYRYQILWLWYVPETTLASIGDGTKAVVISYTGGTSVQGGCQWYAQWSGRSQSTPTVNGAGGVGSTSTNATCSVSASASGADLAGFLQINNQTEPTMGGDLATNVTYLSGYAGDTNSDFGYTDALASSGSKAATWTVNATEGWAVAGIIMEAAGGSIVPQAMAQYINQVIS
jgi:hypothetical protein